MAGVGEGDREGENFIVVWLEIFHIGKKCHQYIIFSIKINIHPRSSFRTLIDVFNLRFGMLQSWNYLPIVKYTINIS